MILLKSGFSRAKLEAGGNELGLCSVDKHAVAVMKVVGHVPSNLAPRFSQFLIRNVKKAFAVK